MSAIIGMVAKALIGQAITKAGITAKGVEVVEVARTKGLLTSKTTWGGIIAVLMPLITPPVMRWLGLPEVETVQFIEYAIGLALIIYGRYKAGNFWGNRK